MCNLTLIVREEETSEHRKQKQGDKLTWQGRDPAGSAFIFHYRSEQTNSQAIEHVKKIVRILQFVSSIF